MSLRSDRRERSRLSVQKWLGAKMRDELFDELLQSVREAGKIRRGEQKPSRSFTFEEPDVAAIREGLALSQEKFAMMMGISVGTLRNWEQRRRKPEGPARALLRVAALHPEAVLESVGQAPRVGGEERRSG